MSKPDMILLKNMFTIYRFSPDCQIPEEVYGSLFYWIGKTDEELTIVCDSSVSLECEKKNENWSCFKVAGPIDFSVTGVLAGISDVLSAADISIFALSTYDTDYILLKTNSLESAKKQLKEKGYRITEHLQ